MKPSANGTTLRSPPCGGVCLLGMHRSGTSLTSRMLNLLGVYQGAPEQIMPGNESNPKGHWENVQITEINDEMLKRLGGSWHEPPVLFAGWENSPLLAELRNEARALLGDCFGEAPLWGWKDPRTCITLPFWQRLVPGLRFVVALRNPLDVAISLQRRNGFPIPKGINLWIGHVTSILEHTAGRPRHFLFYEDALADDSQELHRLSQYLGGTDATVSQEQMLRDFIDKNLQHSHTSLASTLDDVRVPYPVKALYLALRQHVNLEQFKMFSSSSNSSSVDDPLSSFGVSSFHACREPEGTDLQPLLRHLSKATEQIKDAQTSLQLASDYVWYQDLLERIRKVVVQTLSGTSTVLVASKGDPNLLKICGSKAKHFPQSPTGGYSGHHPADDEEAIAHLEQLICAGARFFLVPSFALWMLNDYPAFGRHVRTKYRLLHEQADTCMIFDLS